MHSDATRIINVMGGIVDSATRSGAHIEVTYGQVFGVDAGNSVASAYLAGSREMALSDGGVPEPSQDIRIPGHLFVSASDYVRMSLDDRGHKWIDEVLPTSLSAKVQIDISGGRVLFNDGVGAPDTILYRSAAGVLKTDGSLIVNGVVKAGSSSGDAVWIGDDAKLVDINTADAIGIQGQIIPANGKIVFGSALDTNLYRSAANVLKTDDTFVAANIAVGEVLITPVANTPTSVTVTGLAVSGTKLTCTTSPGTSVPGSTVTETSYTSLSSTGATVWVYRTNTTVTAVSYQIIGV